MIGGYDNLSSLRVRNFMTSGAITVSAGDTMQAAAQTLQDNGISGAPVVDERGQFVGILSANDFVRLAMSGKPRELVRNYMSSRVRTAEPNETLIETAVTMCEHHIHRLPVIGQDQKPCGMVSSLDVVSVVLNFGTMG